MFGGMDLYGFKELDRFLEQLPRAAEKQVIYTVLGKSTKPFKRALRREIPVKTGNLKRSVRSGRMRRRIYGPEVWAGPMAPHAHLVALGTAERRVKNALVAAGPGKQRADGSWDGPRRRVRNLNVGAVKPNRYDLRAWDQSKDEVLQTMASEMGRELVKRAERMARRAGTMRLSRSELRSLGA